MIHDTWLHLEHTALASALLRCEHLQSIGFRAVHGSIVNACFVITPGASASSIFSKFWSALKRLAKFDGS